MRKIDIIKNKIETYNKYLILTKKYDNNTKNYKDELKNCDCPICLTTVTQYTFYKYNHFLCSECFTNWDKIKKTCPICQGIKNY